MSLTRGIRVKLDKSNISDLKKPFNTRNKFDREVLGSIELAYLRGEQAGYEKALKQIGKQS